MVRVIEISGASVVEVELSQFSVDVILADREETRDDYDPEEDGCAAAISITESVEFTTVTLFNSEGEATFYVGKRQDFVV